MRQGLIAFFLGLLLGLVPMYLENQRVKQTYQEERETLTVRAERAGAELEEVREKLEVALLRDQLSSLILEIERENFGTARLKSTHFFDRLRDSLPDIEKPPVRETLRNVLGRRDEVTAALASTDGRIASQLLEIYEGFPQATTLTVPPQPGATAAVRTPAPMEPEGTAEEGGRP